MRIAVAEVLGSHLRPLCSRDNRVMKYESAGFKANTGTRRHTIVVSKDAVFGMTPQTAITCSLQCPATRTLSTSPA